jgi:hypothetical protein
MAMAKVFDFDACSIKVKGFFVLVFVFPVVH